MRPFPKLQYGMVKAFMALIFLDMFACRSIQKSPSFQDGSEGSQNTNAFPWQAITEQEFIAQVMAPGLGSVSARPATDPVRQRLQLLLDQLDHGLREKNPEALKNVPSPQIFLWENAAAHAYVSSIDVCLNKSGQLQGASGASEDFLGLDRERLGVVSVPGPKPCPQLPYQRGALQAFMNWYVKPFPGCRVRVTQRRLDFASACLDASLFGLHATAQTRDVFVRLSSNWIVLSTGLLQSLNEHEAVAMLFHEAGHYYAGHASQPRKLSQEQLYWLKARETAARMFAEGASGQRYHSGLYPVARQMIQDWIRKEGRGTACKDLSQHFLTAQGLEQFPQEKLEGRGQESYRLYESKLDLCLADLALDAAMQERMLGFLNLAVPWSAKVLPPLPPFTRVQELWLWLNGRLPDVLTAPEKRWAEISPREDEPGVAVDTREQDADQQAIVWLKQFGIDPQYGITAVLKQLRLVAPHTGAYTYEQCVRAYATKFRARDGGDLRVPVGDYYDPHHSSCYRAYHMNRAIQNHGSMAIAPRKTAR